MVNKNKRLSGDDLESQCSSNNVKLCVGDIVNFHATINGPVISHGHTITHIQLMPNNFGEDVAWITNLSGCVALAALSKKQ